MAKVKCKGTVLKQDISSVLTAVAQVISLNLSGSQSETVECRELDPVDNFVGQEPNGWSQGGDLSGRLYYDPALAGHQAMTGLIASPAKTDWQVTYADSGSTTQSFNGAGIGFDIGIDPENLLEADFSIKINGNPGFST